MKISLKDDYLENKWWHRLAKVIIYVVTLIVAVFSLVDFLDRIDEWKNPYPQYIYSFEKGYSEAFGFSKPCVFSPDNSKERLSIECGDAGKSFAPLSIYDFLDEKSGIKPQNENHYPNLIDFLNRYSKSITYREEYLIKENHIEINSDCGIKTGLDELLCRTSRNEPMLFRESLTNFDYKSFNEKIEQGNFDNISAKKIILLGPLLESLVSLIFLPLITFVVLKFVIYKTIIYIIFGKKKNKIDSSVQ